jgi:hypothetical protein
MKEGIGLELSEDFAIQSGIKISLGVGKWEPQTGLIIRYRIHQFLTEAHKSMPQLCKGQFLLYSFFIPGRGSNIIIPKP